MEGAGQGLGRTEGACVRRGQGELKGAACAFPVPAQRQLAPTQLLCINKAAAAPGKAEDAAPVPEGCSGWSRVPAGLGLFLEPVGGVGGCYFTGGKGFGRGLSCVHHVILQGTAELAWSSAAPGPSGAWSGDASSPHRVWGPPVRGRPARVHAAAASL